MLKNEAAWLRTALAELPSDALSPLLSVGSGTIETRDGRQPWIAEEVFAPLAARGIEVLHHEHRAGNGVDLVGDLTDPSFLASLPGTGARSVLCCNVLEHLPDPGNVAAALTGVVASGCFAIVTVPRAYPYHPDPIDTMLRPSPDELAALFPDLVVRRAAEVECGTLVDYAWSVRGKGTMALNGARLAIERLRGKRSVPATGAAATRPPEADRPEGSSRHYLRNATKVTCAVLERRG
jgi:hypothetical protein